MMDDDGLGSFLTPVVKTIETEGIPKVSPGMLQTHICTSTQK